jgi:hypothetical protein
MFTPEVPRYRCQHCDSALQAAPEYECSEWFLRCVSCGAKNLFVLTVSFIRWRPAESAMSLEDSDSIYSIASTRH